MTRRWIVVGLIFTGILISYIDRGNLGIAAPSIMREFSFSPSSMGMLLSAFFWTYALFQIPAGTIVDRFGIRIVYAVAFLLWSLASAAIGLSRGLCRCYSDCSRGEDFDGEGDLGGIARSSDEHSVAR